MIIDNMSSHEHTASIEHLPSQSEQPPLGMAILAAALALPGMHTAARAETPPERSTISVRYMHYEDSQPGLDRISVRSPSVSVLAPIAGEWTLEGSLVSDSVSGASPHYHSAISGASRMQDNRTAGDIKVTRYLPNGTVSIGAAYSTEHDYVSRALSIQASKSTEDRNTTWTAGLGFTHDDINPVNFAVVDEKKNSVELMAGVTQVLTAQDIAQLNLAYTRGRGYFSDPYKFLENRPRERDQRTMLLRWNHHFRDVEGTSRLSYRYYSDTFGIRAHTFGAEYVQPTQHGWTVTPSVRVYSQSAADFYYDAIYDKVFGPPIPAGYVFGSKAYSSLDQRLSAFGARTFGIKVEKQLTADMTIDVKFETYRQRTGWRLFGSGSPGLDDFTAKTLQVGLSRQW